MFFAYTYWQFSSCLGVATNANIVLCCYILKRCLIGFSAFLNVPIEFNVKGCSSSHKNNMIIITSLAYAYYFNHFTLILHSIDEFLSLMRSRYKPSFSCQNFEQVGTRARTEVSMFDMEQLEEDILSNIISGKPLIMPASLLRTVFKFREMKEDIADCYAE